MDTIKRDPESYKGLRLNSWNKYKAIKAKYDGLIGGMEFEEGDSKWIDLEHEYGLTLLDFDSSEDDEEIVNMNVS